MTCSPGRALNRPPARLHFATRMGELHSFQLIVAASPSSPSSGIPNAELVGVILRYVVPPVKLCDPVFRICDVSDDVVSHLCCCGDVLVSCKQCDADLLEKSSKVRVMKQLWPRFDPQARSGQDTGSCRAESGQVVSRRLRSRGAKDRVNPGPKVPAKNLNGQLSIEFSDLLIPSAILWAPFPSIEILVSCGHGIAPE
jgi:hypothetical protein